MTAAAAFVMCVLHVVGKAFILVIRALIKTSSASLDGSEPQKQSPKGFIFSVLFFHRCPFSISGENKGHCIALVAFMQRQSHGLVTTTHTCTCGAMLKN